MGDDQHPFGVATLAPLLARPKAARGSEKKEL
jgi:hypothetical protein